MVKIAEYVKEIRRKLHRLPELAFCEFETQKSVETELKAFGIPFREAGTGVIADLNLAREKTLAFRSDMDALPIAEKSGAEYASEIPGCMHACGHDGHMAILLGFAKFCSENRDLLLYNVRFIFQPAEEGSGGAVSMIEAGALEGVSEIYAIHLDPSVEGGKAGLSYGASMAGDFEFDVHFMGEAAHCAEKRKGHDALLASSEFVCSLGDLVGRSDAVLHAGKIEGGAARNVVADSVKLSCSMRYFDEKDRDKLLHMMEFQLGYLKDRYGVRSRLEKIVEYIPLKNNKSCVDKLKRKCESVMLGKRYLSEDFAFYLDKVKGAILWLGVKKNPETKLHAADFDFDESNLVSGVEIYRRLVTEAE